MQHYKREEDSVIFEYLKDQNINGDLLDIGARKGNWYKQFKTHYPKNTAHLFEPTPNIAEYLNKNYNKFKNVNIHGIALSDQAGEFDFHINKDKPAWSGLVKHPNHSYTTVKVPVKTVDDFGFQNVSVMKIDVEGNEYRTLRGASTTILMNKPIIYFECADVHLHNYTNTSRDVFEFLKMFKYNILDLDMKNLTVDEFANHTASKPSYYHNFIAHV